MAGFLFAAGCLLWQVVGLPGGRTAVAVALLAIGAAGVPRGRGVALVLAGLAWTAWQAGQYRAAWLDPALAGRDLVITCRIQDFPGYRGGALRFPCRTLGAHRVDGGAPVRHLPPRVRLVWYGPPRRLQPGEVWALGVRLRPPEGMRNPAGFDYAAWLFRQGFGATGRVLAWPAPRRLADRAGPVDRLRRWFAGRLEAVGPLPTEDLLRAITLGIRDRPATEAFRRTGTAHLLAISGLHVGLVSGFFMLLVRGLWRRSARLCARLPAPRAAAAAGLLGAVGYAALAGFSLPTQRAAVMLGALLGMRLCGRVLRPGQAVSLALGAVLVCDPLAPAGPGFWLSFVAVLALWLIARDRPHGGGLGVRLRRALQVQWRLSLAMVPLTSLLFDQVLWLSPLANLVAVPFFGMVVLPLALFGMLGLALTDHAAGVLYLAGRLATDLAGLLERLAELPQSRLWWHPPPGTAWALVLAVALWLLPRGVPGRRAAAFLLLPVLLPALSGPLAGHFELMLFDVGQGLAAAVRTQGHLLVYDTGWRSRSGFDTGQAVVLPWILHQGLRHVDILVVSHGDLDHRGGARSLDRALPVYRVLTSVPERIGWRRATACRDGQAWSWDGVRFRVLAPAGGSRGNDASCVLQVETADGRRLLLTGDLERSGERRLVARHPVLASEVLLVPHHGSVTSSSPDFVRRVHPCHALVSAGRHRHGRFPAPAVLDRYRDLGSRIWITARLGAIQCRLGGPEAAVCRAAAAPFPGLPARSRSRAGAQARPCRGVHAALWGG